MTAEPYAGMCLLTTRHQRRVATRGRRVHRHRLLSGKTRQIMRAAGLGPGARQSVAAERLHADHGADHVAVDIDVTDWKPVDHGLDGVVDARVNSERQSVAA